MLAFSTNSDKSNHENNETRNGESSKWDEVVHGVLLSRSSMIPSARADKYYRGERCEMPPKSLMT